MSPTSMFRDAVFADQLDRSFALLARGRALASISAVSFAGVCWGQIPPSVLIPLTAFTMICSEAVISLGAWRARSPDRYHRRWYGALVAGMTLAGVAWGAQIATTIYLAAEPATKMAAIAFGIGVAGANVVFGSPFRLPFWGMQAALLLPMIGAEVATGESFLVWMAVSAVANIAFSWLLHEHVHRALVESIEAHHRLAHQAEHDPLTGLPNRTALAKALDAVLGAGKRVGVLFIDLDRFKVVNDSLGHDVGDQLLAGVARRLVEEVGLAGRLFRVGGDELIAVIPDPAGDEQVATIAQRLHGAMRAPVVLPGRELPITASIGFVVGPSPGDTGKDMLRHADAALYRAKDHGRNRVEVFDDRMRSDLRRRVDDEQAVREALRVGAIEPWYQPIVDLRTGAVVGAEALARWRHPTRGVLAAGAFIPLVEESGMVGALTDVIVTRVVRDLATWKREGASPIRVKINLGAEPFARPQLARWIAETLREHDCPAAAVGVEVTETSLLTDLALAVEHLRALRAIGLTVALDDFGTAWSSLALLRQLPLDAVKIDRMFLRDITEKEEDRALVGAVVSLARQFRLEVIAEGIETEPQARVAAALGCGSAQGFLYAPAVPADELLRLVGAAPWSAGVGVA